MLDEFIAIRVVVPRGATKRQALLDCLKGIELPHTFPGLTFDAYTLKSVDEALPWGLRFQTRGVSNHNQWVVKFKEPLSLEDESSETRGRI